VRRAVGNGRKRHDVVGVQKRPDFFLERSLVDGGAAPNQAKAPASRIAV
jgi:hypothetical protein